MVTLRRCRGVDAAAGQLIVREAGGLVSFTDCDDPLGAPLDADAELASGGGPHPREPARAGADPGVIDWILAEKIAAYVAGSGDAAPPAGRPGRAGRRVRAAGRAPTPGCSPPGRCRRPRGSSAGSGSPPTSRRCGALLDPVLERAGEGLGPLRPAVQLALGLVVTTEVAVVLGYLAQRVLGQYELVLLDEGPESSPPRLLFVLPNLGQAVQAFDAQEEEFMTWVTLHEVTHAVQFSGVPWLHGHVAGLVRELLGSAELRMDAERKLRLPSAAEIRRVAGALRRGDLISIFTTAPSARRSTACRR